MDSSEPEPPTFGQWLFLAAACALIGFAAIVALFFMFATTLFDYNGKQSGPEELSALEVLLVFSFVAVGGACAFLLNCARKARRPGDFRFWHALPLLLATVPVVMAVLALALAASEIIN